VKPFCRLSGWVALPVLLLFLPSAFGQSPANPKATSAMHNVLNYQPPSLLAFALTAGNDLYNNNNGKGGKGNNGGNGNGGNGNGGNGNGGYGNGGYGNGGYGNGGNGGYGNGGYGNGGYGNGGNGGGCGYGQGYGNEKCKALPEGGTALMYLLLAGLSCLGAMFLRSRRQASMPEAN
jgi:hypothetical protein